MREGYDVFPVHVWAIVRGVELEGEGSVAFGEEAVDVIVDGGRLLIPFAAVDGARTDFDEMALFLANGDVVELTGNDALGDASPLLAERACSFPEQTRALRALGSTRARPGDAHDRFFAPLLAARRDAEGRMAPEARLRAFDARWLRERYRSVLREFAAERFPSDAPERRALEAELTDAAEPVFTALDALEQATAAAREPAEDTRFARWRAWSSSVHHLFAEADRSWLACSPRLDIAPARPSGFWRRLLRLGAAVIIAGATAVHVGFAAGTRSTAAGLLAESEIR